MLITSLVIKMQLYVYLRMHILFYAKMFPNIFVTKNSNYFTIISKFYSSKKYGKMMVFSKYKIPQVQKLAKHRVSIVFEFPFPTLVSGGIELLSRDSDSMPLKNLEINF